MKVLWFCGLPDDVRKYGARRVLSETPAAAWSWVLGHLPPPPSVELHILCPVQGKCDSSEDHFEYKGAIWHCFPQYRRELLFLWRRFYFSIRKFVVQLNPDVVHGWGGETGCGLLATLVSSHSVVSVQGILPMLWQIERKKTFRLADRFLAICEKSAFKNAGICLTESVTACKALETIFMRKGIVVPHPLRAAFLKSSFSQTSQKRRMSFFACCRFDLKKGALDILSAFKMVRKPIRLVICGAGWSESVINEYVDNTEIRSRIVVLPYCDEYQLTGEMAKCSFFVLPSYCDTGPTALKEAISQGLYPICYDNTGPHELVTKYTGRLVPTGDVTALASAMESVVEDVDSVQDAVGDAAIRIRHDLSPEIVWGKLLEIYKDQGV